MAPLACYDEAIESRGGYKHESTISGPHFGQVGHWLRARTRQTRTKMDMAVRLQTFEQRDQGNWIVLVDTLRQKLLCTRSLTNPACARS